jgi:tRNA threonylcarbamoyl adenosine modification protein YeaZ
MRLLAIETSGRACSVALFDDEQLIASRHALIGRGHAEALIPWIADLPDGGRSDSILVGCGPGSFTGVRIGIAAARALGLGWGVPVLGFSSLALVAAGFATDAPFLVAVEGGHGEIFVQSFAPAPLRAVSAQYSLTPDAAAAHDFPATVIGTGATRLVAARGTGRAEPLEACADHVLLIEAEARCRAPVPIYGRGADARPMA